MIDNVLLAALIAKAGGNVTPEQIQEAVNAYLQEHPVGTLTLTGTTVTMTGGGN